MHTFFVFTKCYWSIHSEVVMLGKNAHSKQRKATHTQTLQFHVGGSTSVNLIRILIHRAYSTVVQLFSKQSHMIVMYFCSQTRSP